MSRHALPNEALLANWLASRPEDFDTPAAQVLIAQLVDFANMAQKVARARRLHHVWWTLVDPEARFLAGRRQLAAYAARTAMRSGMSESQAFMWAAGLATKSREAFKAACTHELVPGERLYVWQWRELCKLHESGGLTGGAMDVRRWVQMEEPWLFDERWIYPLHLVDADCLPQGVTQDTLANSLRPLEAA
jgi:hypothetical protein